MLPHRTSGRTPWKYEYGISGASLGSLAVSAREPGRHYEDEWLAHMLPDENGALLVMAHCGHHYVMQSQKDLLAGVEARCEVENCRWRLMLERRAA